MRCVNLYSLSGEIDMEEVRLVLEQYGLWLVAFGAFFQGYLWVIVAGFLAVDEVFRLADVLVVAALSAWLGHWFFYVLGQWFSRHRSYLATTRLNKPIQTFDQTITHHPWASVFLMQYGHGIRLVSAVAFGFFKMNLVWFAWAQILNCALWACVLVSAGYFAGLGLYAIPSGAHLPVFVTFATLLALFLLFRKHWRNTAGEPIDKYEKIAAFIEKEPIV
jgi:membrane protein DedA with SNARE-associated domain